MISEGSYDTEDWSDDAENSALITGINYILYYIKIENSSFKLQYNFTKFLFLLHFSLNKCILSKHKNLLKPLNGTIYNH